MLQDEKCLTSRAVPGIQTEYYTSPTQRHGGGIVHGQKHLQKLMVEADACGQARGRQEPSLASQVPTTYTKLLKDSVGMGCR